MLRASSLRSPRFPQEGTGGWGGVYQREFFVFLFGGGHGGVALRVMPGRGSKVRRQVLWFLVPVSGEQAGETH